MTLSTAADVEGGWELNAVSCEYYMNQTTHSTIAKQFQSGIVAQNVNPQRPSLPQQRLDKPSDPYSRKCPYLLSNIILYVPSVDSSAPSFATATHYSNT